MKRLFLISIALTLLLVGSMTQPIQSLHETEDQSISPIQVDQTTSEVSRPIFVNVTGVGYTASTIRERNDSLGLGAQIKTQLRENVTITYKVVNGANVTDLRLFADIPGNYSLTNETETLAFTFKEIVFENITVPYTNEFFFNASVAYYTAKLNVSSDIVPFYAAIGSNSEVLSNAPYNLFTTQQLWSVTSEDDFYIQDEKVKLNLEANLTDVTDIYGLRYKLSTDTEFTAKNFTSLSGATVNKTSVIELGPYEPGTSIYFYSYAIIADKYYEHIDYQFVDVGDGKPVLDVSLPSNYAESKLINNTYYTRNFTVTFEISATVSKGNITSFLLKTGNDLVTKTQLNENVSLNGESIFVPYEFSNNTINNVTITAITNKGVSLQTNVNYTIVVDTVIPTAHLKDVNLNNKVVTKNGQVTFTFDFSDETSGIFIAILNLGDGFSIEVTSMGEYTYVYTNITKSATYEVTLTVIDKAGNENFGGILLEVEYDDGLDVTSANTFIGLIVAISIIAIIYFLPAVIKFISEKLNR